MVFLLKKMQRISTPIKFVDIDLLKTVILWKIYLHFITIHPIHLMHQTLNNNIPDVNEYGNAQCAQN